jgi:predicted permease
MEEEIRLHIDMETERLEREEGLDPGEARRRALVAFGGVERCREELREGRGLAWLGAMKLDLWLGWRMLAKYPGLSLVGVVGMAVAVAVGTVSFGIIYTFVGSTVPLDEGDRVVAIQNHTRTGYADGTHLHDLATWREGLRAVKDFGAYRMVDRNLITGEGRPEPVRIAEMTASGFRVARVPPLLGRHFNDEDERKGAAPVAVIGYTVWRSRFAGQPDVVGRTIRLGATPHTVIGVMPEGFAFPVNNRIWTPLRLDPLDYERGEAPPVEVFGRLAPGATLGGAQAQLEVIGKRLAAVHPASHEHVRPWVLPYARAFLEFPAMAWALHLAQLGISMIMVVIGTNVAILVYARTATRTGEIAVRTALGASRRRVVAQLFTEALVLSATAAAVGLAAGWFALRQADAVISRMGGEQLPFWWDFGVSPGTVLYVAGLAVLGAVVVGVVPALKATRRDVQASLQLLGPGGSGMRLGWRWTALIVAQVAVSVALLPLAIAGTGNWLRVRAAGPGFPAAEFLAAPLHLDREGDATDAPAEPATGSGTRFATLQAELVRRLEAEPGVADVVLASAAPGADRFDYVEAEGASDAARPGTPAPTGGAGHRVWASRVGLDFFSAFGIPLLAGRLFQAADAAAAGPGAVQTPVVVNRSFVDKVLGGGDPLGRRVRPVAEGGGADPEEVRREPWYEIVGVVPDFPRPSNLQRQVEPRMYHPLVPAATHPVTVIVRVRGAPAASFAGRLRELTVAVDPMLRLGSVGTLDDTLDAEGTLDRAILLAAVLVILSVLLLSAAGVYALMSLSVTRRRREIGIRSALGAGPRVLVRSVLSRAMAQIAAGIAVGFGVAAVMDDAMQGGWTGGRGLLLLLSVAALMMAVGIAAAVGPARRALRIPPTEALKAE